MFQTGRNTLLTNITVPVHRSKGLLCTSQAQGLNHEDLHILYGYLTHNHLNSKNRKHYLRYDNKSIEV